MFCHRFVIATFIILKKLVDYSNIYFWSRCNNEKYPTAVGDISTHFFDENGEFVEIYENTLCATKENLKDAKETIAIACGKDKIEAIKGALKTRIIDTLITDEYTARKILADL